MVKIIGIDPGLAATGVGIVTGEGLKVRSYSYGTIRTSSTIPLPGRLDSIYSKLFQILEQEKPALMVVEEVFSVDNYPRSGITLGKVTGALMIAGFRAQVPVVEIAVREAKQVLSGYGMASKEQLEKAVRHTLGVKTPIRPFHASDAVGLALIGLFRYQDKQTGPQCRHPR
jgi:crossover junction endodeoxyribonuclease RuvC